MIRRQFRRLRAAARRLGLIRTRRVGGREWRFGGLWVELPGDPDEAEPWMDAIYRAGLALGPGAFVDVGVNRGQTLFKVLAIDPARRYLGFEPQLRSALAVRDFAARNGLGTVEVAPTALSDAPGALRLNMRGDTGFDGAASILPELRGADFYRRGEIVPAITGDAALEGLGIDDVAMIKIDVEGAELEVLRGLRGSLARLRPAVAFEALNDWRDPAGDAAAEAQSAAKKARAAAICELFEGLDYALFHVTRAGPRPIGRIEIRVCDDISQCNYVAVPRDRAEAFASG